MKTSFQANAKGSSEIRDALYWFPAPAIMIQSDDTKA